VSIPSSFYQIYILQVAVQIVVAHGRVVDEVDISLSRFIVFVTAITTGSLSFIIEKI